MEKNEDWGWQDFEESDDKLECGSPLWRKDLERRPSKNYELSRSNSELSIKNLRSIRSSASFKELEQAMANIAMTFNDSQHSDSSNSTNNKSSPRSMNKQTQHNNNRGNNKSDITHEIDDNLTKQSVKQDLQLYIIETCSRSLLIINSSERSREDVKSLCEGFGDLSYFIDEFSMWGIYFVGYFDSESSQKAVESIADQLNTPVRGTDDSDTSARHLKPHWSAHYSVPLVLNESELDYDMSKFHIKLMSQNLINPDKTTNAVELLQLETSLQERLDQYGPLRCIQKSFPMKTSTSRNYMTLDMTSGASKSNEDLSNSVASNVSVCDFVVEFFDIRNTKKAFDELSLPANSNITWKTEINGQTLIHSYRIFPTPYPLDTHMKHIQIALCSNVFQIYEKFLHSRNSDKELNNTVDKNIHSVSSQDAGGSSDNSMQSDRQFDKKAPLTTAINTLSTMNHFMPSHVYPVLFPRAENGMPYPYPYVTHFHPSDPRALMSMYGPVYPPPHPNMMPPMMHGQAGPNGFYPYPVSPVGYNYHTETGYYDGTGMFFPHPRVDPSHPFYGHGGANPQANQPDSQTNNPNLFKNSRQHRSGNDKPRPPHHNGAHVAGMNSHPRKSDNNATTDTVYTLNMTALKDRTETRTTIMIRNIPNKYTQSMLMEEINHTHKNTYDFFYLPIDFKNKCNVGYAFVNFNTIDDIISFHNTYHQRKWSHFNSDKICYVAYARIQGKQAMINRFQNSSLLDKDDEYKPLLFVIDREVIVNKTNESNSSTYEPVVMRLEPFPSKGKSTSRESMANMGNDDANTISS
jgi:hypothetical protein